METAQSVLQSIHSGDWMISLDLQDAYLQVPVHPESRKYLRFCLDDKVYQFRVLCFGLSSAPQVFTRVTAPVSSIMHRFWFRILHYLDDWLVLGSSFSEIVRARDFLLALCSELGMQVNLPKSSLTPSQRQDYLRMTLQSSPLRAFPSQARVQKVLCLVDEFSSLLVQPLSLWRSLLGVMSSLSTLIPGSRLRTRSPTSPSGFSASGVADRARFLGRLLPEGSSVVVRSLPSGRRGRLSSSPSGADSLYRRVRCGMGRVSRLRPPIRLVVSRCFSIFDQPPRTSGGLPCHPGFSPSTPGQVGVSLHRQYVRSFVPPQGRGHLLVDPELRGSGNPLPLRVQRSVSAPPVCTGSPQRLGGLSQLWWPDPRFRVDSPQGCLPGAFPPLAHNGGFVCHLHRLQVYFSPMADLQVAAVDAMIQSWDYLQAYAFPPFGFIQRVLSRVRGSRNLEPTLVAPFWPLWP